MKKKIRAVFAAAVFAVFSVCAYSVQSEIHSDSVNDFLDSENPVKVNKTLPFSKGINLTMWLEPFGIYNSGTTYFSKQDFIDIKNLGAEVIRIPVHFESWTCGKNGSGGKKNFTVQPWLWTYLDNAVSWCEELGLYVIIDFHNDCADGSKTPPYAEKMLSDIWTQIAERYKDRSPYVLYEIMNEPHGISRSAWGKIQGKVLTVIRSIDKTHFVIVGGADYNSVEALLELPEYNDDKLIYNFHDYSPFLFTHQGAQWSGLQRMTGIPFPYRKEKMPALPKFATDTEKWNYNNYEKSAEKESLTGNLDRAVAFANKRNAPLMCNEFGVYMKYAENTERVNWYKIKTAHFSNRNIARVSWDYFGGFGVFKTPDGGVFPGDLNAEIVAALGFAVPGYKNETWFSRAEKNRDYTIYKNGFAEKISAGGWIKKNSGACDFYRKDSPSEDSYISIPNLTEYDSLVFSFKESCDFSALEKSGRVLEFCVRTDSPNFKMSVYFKNSAGAKFQWRAGIFLNAKNVSPDGQWHKVSVPLSEFYDYGAWDDGQKKWIPPENAFSWSDVVSLSFEAGEGQLKGGVALKDIGIK